MGRFLMIVVLSGAAFAQLPSSTVAKLTSDTSADVPSKLEGPSVVVPSASATLDMPAMPKGKSTIIGGAIREVDGVRDQLTLNIFGGRTMKVLFDERTQLYRDGQKTPLRALRAGDHASVETVLDGTTIFARSIHILSQLPEGECQGQVLSYDRSKGELLVRS
jgi:hypothetical protein